MLQRWNFRLTIPGYLRNKYLYLFILLCGLNSIFVSVPLTNSLGYEFSAINGIVLFLFFGFLSIQILKKKECKISPALKENRLVIILLLIIPLLIGSISSLFLSRCPIKDGFGFYFVITIPAALFGIMTGMISVLMNKKYAALIFTLFFFMLLLITLIEFYFNPQVYFYNPVYGFFPGTIYDEDIALNYRLFFSQLYHLFFFGTILAVIRYWRKNTIRAFLLYVFLPLIFLVSILFKPFLGLATDVSQLNRNLDRIIITPHFFIHCGNKIDKSNYEFIGLLHEYYYDLVSIKLNEGMNKRINSYIFNDKNQKRELFGAGNADVAKPWLNQIFLNYENYDVTLKHEIAHVIAGKFGKSVFKVADGFNPAMIEGIAMFVEDDFAGYPVTYAAKLAYTTGNRINFNSLFNGMNFFTSYSSLAYIYSGAFLDFLLREYGVDKIKEIYNDSNWLKIYGEELPILLKRFEKSLSVDSVQYNSNQAQLFFGGQTIFKKFCPRMASNDIKEASGLMNLKKYSDAEKKYRDVYHYSASYTALSGIVASLQKQKKYPVSAELLNKEISKFRKSQFFYNLELILGDAFVLADNISAGKKSYDSLITHSPGIGYTNEVKIRNLIIDKEGTDSLKKYFKMKNAKKLDYLLKINRDEINYFTIPSIVRYSDINKFNLAEWLENLKPGFTVQNKESMVSSISISRYFLEKKDFNNAKYFAIKALDYKSSGNLTFQAIENLQLANWFTNFANETKTSFQYQQ